MKPNKAQVANFIRTIALELRALAQKADLPMLACLLEMVVLESATAASSRCGAARTGSRKRLPRA